MKYWLAWEKILWSIQKKNAYLGERGEKNRKIREIFTVPRGKNIIFGNMRRGKNIAFWFSFPSFNAPFFWLFNYLNVGFFDFETKNVEQKILFSDFPDPQQIMIYLLLLDSATLASLPVGEPKKFIDFVYMVLVFIYLTFSYFFSLFSSIYFHFHEVMKFFSCTYRLVLQNAHQILFANFVL